MKVLFLTNNSFGLYRFRKEVIKSLIDIGYDCVVVSPNDEYSEKIKNLGCKTVDININRRGKNILEEIKTFLDMKKILKTENPDIVLTYTIKPNIYGGIISRIYKFDYITNITGIGTAIKADNYLSKILLKLYKIALYSSKKVFFQNTDNFNLFKHKGIIDNNYSLIPGSGVNLEQFEYKKPVKSHKLKFVFIGRVMKDKGVLEFIEAANIIKENTDNCEFIIIGPVEEDFQDAFNKINKNNILYLGEKKEIIKFYHISDIIVLPSYHEGMSNVLLEASSIGRPSIATNIPGCKEIVDNKKTGILIEPRNTDELVKAIEYYLYMNYEEIVAMGKNARHKVENNFDRKLVIDKYLEAIR